MQAMGVLRAARELGLRVPEDLSVIGYDNLPVAEWIGPALTTVNQPLRDMAGTATRMLLDLARGVEPANQPHRPRDRARGAREHRTPCEAADLALFDLPLAQLRRYSPDVPEPDDFDAFWKATLDGPPADPGWSTSAAVATDLRSSTPGT